MCMQSACVINDASYGCGLASGVLHCWTILKVLVKALMGMVQAEQLSCEALFGLKRFQQLQNNQEKFKWCDITLPVTNK